MKKFLSFAFLLSLLLGACAPAIEPSTDAAGSIQEVASVELDVIRKAPELHEGVWLNADQALSLAELKGQVVLLEMWTFGCINCQRVIPHVRDWYQRYKDEGLVVIGNHYPEFDYEADLDNLQAAIVDLDVPYPVLVDNERETWSTYRNRYWPTTYLIDKRGNIRYVHIGEGAYVETEAAIQALLAEEF